MANPMRPQILRPSLIPGATGRAGQDGRDGQNGRDGVIGRDGIDGAPGVVQSVNGKSATSITLTPLDVGAVPQASDGSASLTRLALTAPGSTGDITSMTAGAVSGVTPTSYPSPSLGKITRGQAPIYDMFFKRDGVTPDEPGINAILSDFNACDVLPDQVGGRPSVFVKNSPIVVPTNGKLSGLAGKQRTWITRDVGYTGDTLQMGAVAGGAGAGSAVIDGFWFNHPGRFQGVVPTDFALTNRLTQGQAHIRALGVQGAGIYNCGGWGMPHFIVHQGGSGLDIVRPFVIGGMWDPLDQNRQESISVFNSVYDQFYGYSVNCNIIDPNLIGGNVFATSRSIPIDNKAYTVKFPRIGPRFGALLQCYEVLKWRGGFMGGFAQSNFYISGGGPETLPNGFDPDTGEPLYKPGWVMIRLEVEGLAIDESMSAAVEFVRPNATSAPASGAVFRNCSWNGQLIGGRGIEARSNAGLFSVANLVVDGGMFAAYQGSAIRLYGVNGALISPERIRGYNYASFDTTKGDAVGSGAGIYIADIARGVKVGPTTFGGGANYDTDANSCQFGLADITPVLSGVSTQGNKYYGLDTVNMGLAGGQTVLGGQKFTP